ncbi:probable inactive tRNA-specific adenosine deaminase-like protein 3 [Ruditapes philippinarum]|uniref:probable inactive tRNA-specific adenosine deaminase-like protein 3 n=1 Tax=Ruditapes philippinarum TaxID=129788 RepID=UPI00295BC95A|nr:probable inactive tRNA-specific adenosine deaminase-like protein 3 [Ruditapes philippinarum]
MSDTATKKLKLDKTYQEKCPQLEPVLADKYLAAVKLDDVYICEVTDKKKTSEILRYLTFKYPLDQYPHIKRVKSGKTNGLATVQVIICEKRLFSSADDVRSVLEPFKDSIGKIGVLKIPSCPPLTRDQFNSCIQYWPVNFHENKVPIGAVIVDPVTDIVIAKAYDMRAGSHPLHHATMVCIDLVAKSQGGGMWKYPPEAQLYCVEQDIEINDDSKTGPYLCTGYHLYVTQEPCVM